MLSVINDDENVSGSSNSDPFKRLPRHDDENVSGSDENRPSKSGQAFSGAQAEAEPGRRSMTSKEVDELRESIA